MKKLFTIICLLACYSLAQGQSIKPYLAIVKTSTGKQKGVLQKVDALYLIVQGDSGHVKIDNSTIKSVKIRAIKKGYKGRRYLAHDWSSSTYNQVVNGKFVNKWGEEEPSLGEQVSTTLFGEILNGIVNVIALPIHAINPSIADFRFKTLPTKDQLQSLSYFSINYQQDPKIMLGFKPAR